MYPVLEEWTIRVQGRSQQTLIAHHSATSPEASGDKDYLNWQKTDWPSETGKSSHLRSSTAHNRLGKECYHRSPPPTAQEQPVIPSHADGHHPLELTQQMKTHWPRGPWWHQERLNGREILHNLLCTISLRQPVPVVATHSLHKIHSLRLKDCIVNIMLTPHPTKNIKRVNYVVRDRNWTCGAEYPTMYTDTELVLHTGNLHNVNNQRHLNLKKIACCNRLNAECEKPAVFS